MISHHPSRRRFLQVTSGAVATAAALLHPTLSLATSSAISRRLHFHNLHTLEELDVVYCNNGQYNANNLKQLDYLLRDHRVEKIRRIDTALLNQVWALQQLIGGHAKFEIISGYRSPETNARLRAKSSGVARKSYHMKGRAIDLRLQGTPTSQLYAMAVGMQAGGVGYYPKSDFIHIDTGPVRTWQ